jgi:hypothetical protein
MMPTSEQIIDNAWHAASQRASVDEMAVAAVTALRRIHQVIDESAGETAAAVFRDSVRYLVIQANLRRLRIVRRVPEPKPLPKAEAGARVACAILEDAANGCLALNCAAEDNTPLCEATELLLERLFALLGGTPDAALLASRIVDDRPFLTITVPNDCACPIN